MELEIEEIDKTILQGLTEQENESLKTRKINPGISCTYDIDGENSVTSISFGLMGYVT